MRREARAAPGHLAGSPAPLLRKYLKQRSPPAATGRLFCAWSSSADKPDLRARPDWVLTWPREAVERPRCPAWNPFLAALGAGYPRGRPSSHPTLNGSQADFHPGALLGFLNFQLLTPSLMISRADGFTAPGPGIPPAKRSILQLWFVRDEDCVSVKSSMALQRNLGIINNRHLGE